MHNTENKRYKIFYVKTQIEEKKTTGRSRRFHYNSQVTNYREFFGMSLSWDRLEWQNPFLVGGEGLLILSCHHGGGWSAGQIILTVRSIHVDLL